MRNDQFPSQTCSVARALEIVGEWWTLLIIREAFFGVRRFSEFERNLGVAKNVLSDRLSKLVACGVMERIDVPGRGNPRDYRLTEKGRDLFPVLVALMQWGDRWAAPAGPPLRLLERETGAEIAALRVTGASGAALAPREAQVVPGPGADEKVRRRFPPASEILPR
ncbi:helix-turn-helix domain-containing protein [Methylosinus sp. PW1]|uniref:winged helix-turn-helix transcriptional regulator n=1 Tax=Methylosinus sp. PW1 TaxID=107636 RepID=UPI000562DCEB|nr:helix-turn-helix domain-containing protein [Methylosinus sp. PW1]